MADPIIKVENLFKSYDHGHIRALDGASLEIKRGEFVSLMGPSGSGKSTLLHLIAALDFPDSGEIFIEGKSLKEIKNKDKFRSQTIGLIFQLHNLLPHLTVLENVLMPMMSVKAKSAKRKVQSILESVGIWDKANMTIPKLSGGERQRAAFARALANDPKIILADEPTGSLDSKNSQKVLDLLEKIQKETGVTILMVSHEHSVASRAQRIVHMLDGKIIEKEKRVGDILGTLMSIFK